jgi:hypothetical protein
MLRHWCAVIADRDGVVRDAAYDWEKHWCATRPEFRIAVPQKIITSICPQELHFGTKGRDFDADMLIFKLAVLGHQGLRLLQKYGGRKVLVTAALVLGKRTGSV